jgi:hypothetical protein
MEILVEEIKGLPSEISSGLIELREMDIKSKEYSLSIIEEEKKLFENLDLLIKSNPGFDEKPVTDDYQKILDRKKALLNYFDEQLKKVQSIYQKIDVKISIFGKFCGCNVITK